jgi:hypothetical protein
MQVDRGGVYETLLKLKIKTLFPLTLCDQAVLSHEVKVSWGLTAVAPLWLS